MGTGPCDCPRPWELDHSSTGTVGTGLDPPRGHPVIATAMGTLLAAGTGTSSHPQTASRDGTTPWAAGPAHRVPRNISEVQDVSRKNNEIHTGISGWHLLGCEMVMAQGEPAAIPWDVQIPVFPLQCTDTSIPTHLVLILIPQPPPAHIYTGKAHFPGQKSAFPSLCRWQSSCTAFAVHSNPTALGAGSSLAWRSLALINTH